MRRSLIFIVCICILGMSVFPAFAAETSGSYLNILDFVSVNNSNSNFFSFVDEGSISFDLSETLGRVRVYGFEFTYMTTSKNATVTDIRFGGHSITDYDSSVTGQSGNNITHVIGSCGGLAQNHFSFDFEADGQSYITVVSFIVHLVDFNRFNIPATLSCGTQSVTLSPGGQVSIASVPSTGAVTTPQFSIRVSKSYWQDADYLDLNGLLICTNISSIAAFTGDDTSLKVETSFINSNVGTDSPGNYLFTVRVDLTSLDKSNTDSDILIIFNTVSYPSGFNTFYLNGLNGCIVSAPVDAEMTWYQILWNTITEGFEGVIAGLTGMAGEELPEEDKEAMADSSDKMGDLSSDMAGSTPEIDTSGDQFFAGDIVDLRDFSFLNFIGGLMSFDITAVYMTVLAILILLSYVFFGKK